MKKFTDDYKRQIITELDACKTNLDRAVVLKREGLGHRQSTMFRRQLESARPLRRHRTLEEKIDIVAEFNACTEPGEKTRIAQREGIEPTTIYNWRKQLSSTT
jgi:ribosomal protein L10